MTIRGAPQPSVRPSNETSNRAAGLTLAPVSKRTRMDPATLSRLENGRQPNPTIDTLWRYARAVGRRLLLSHAATAAPTNGRATARK